MSLYYSCHNICFENFKVAQLEESLELMQGEFESMEDYWQRKLEEERVFYEEQLRSSELPVSDSVFKIFESQPK